jgi:hypothetical protein
MGGLHEATPTDQRPETHIANVVLDGGHVP